MEVCETCGEELTGRIGDPMGWTWRGCPRAPDDEEDPYPCRSSSFNVEVQASRRGRNSDAGLDTPLS
jgi:ssDNA-binding Zn-finger/Zn-ribbon topoisomerase 1